MNFWVIILFFLSVMVILIAALFMLGALDLEPSESLSEEIESRTGIKISNEGDERIESSYSTYEECYIAHGGERNRLSAEAYRSCRHLEVQENDE